MTLDELISAVAPADERAMQDARDRQAQLTKPVGALGVLEDVSIKLAGIQAVCPPPALSRPVVAVFAGDHGVHAQGVTPWPQEVTAAMVENFRAGGAAVNVLARRAGADVYVVDMGVAADLVPGPWLLDHKLRKGTSDLATGPAMSREEAVRGILAGADVAQGLVDDGHDCLLTGDMGIANTTPSAALVAAFTGAAPELVVGRGTGVDDATLARKVEVVLRALRDRPVTDDPVETLASLGGFEHAGLTGYVLGAASRRVPVVLDGVIAGAAALVAAALAPDTVDYLFAGHRSVEPGHAVALGKLGLRPVVDLDLRLGEGTGAALAFPVIESAGAVLREMATFDSAGVTRKDDFVADFPPYPSGLLLGGRRVLVVGGGHVAQRRIPRLLASGADVVVVSPVTTPAVEGLAGSGEITWHERGFEPADVEEAWYVIAATDDPAANEAVSRECESRRIFCVRADDATQATAWTPAVGRHAGVTVAVLGNREPRRSAGVRDAIVAALRDGAIAAPQDDERTPGVVLVGGGPGDPELVTVAARRALSEADVVVADRLAPRELLDELSPDVELVDVAKLPRGRAAAQEEINRLIVDRAREGKRVVRFKGGDSFVYGRGYEEVLACEAAGVPWSVIPGLTSALAVPAAVGIPVTHRGVAHDFTVISGHLPPDDPDSLVEWDAVARMRGTVVLLMAVKNLPDIAARLVKTGRSGDTPVAIVSEGTMPGERTLVSTLDKVADDMAREQVRPPAIVVIGDVVAVARGAGST